jgi:GxxExxY protein
MIVDDKLVIEAKSSYRLPVSAQRQLYNYLKAAKLRVGLLLHFGPEPKFYREVVLSHRRIRGAIERNNTA